LTGHKICGDLGKKGVLLLQILVNIYLDRNPSMAGIFLYLRLGMTYESLSCYLDHANLVFSAAQDVKTYQTAHEHSINILNLADQVGANDLAFGAAVTAADSAFFASQSTKEFSSISCVEYLQRWTLSVWSWR
jgi:hypothetical protein